MCNKITFPCLLAHSGRFLINAWFKLIIVVYALFELGHHPVMPAIPRLRTSAFHIEITTFKMLKPCLMEHVHHYDSTSKQWLSTAFFFWLSKKTNKRCKCSFLHTNVDMITEWYNTDAIVWRAQLLCVFRLMSNEETDIVSNSYATYYSVKLSLRKTGKDLCIHLVFIQFGISVE